ncbi:MAG: RimK family alpha-L-glutamate ligase [Dehalococcoidia bacterium]
MILVIGNIGDQPAAYICSRMLDREVDFILFDSRQYPNECDLTWGIDHGDLTGFIRQGTKLIDLADVNSMYLRNMGHLPKPGEEIVPEDAHRNARNLAALRGFTERAPILVVNRYSGMATNSSKPYQAQLIDPYFRVPKTLVTNSPAEVRDFYDECHGRVIYKSASGVRSVVKRLQPEDLQRLDRIRACPTQFQECVPGTDIRVHTVGQRVFAAEILSDAIDYRYASQEGVERVMRDIALPDDVAARCLAVTAATGLYMGGVDLRRSPDGDYYCFEVNPSPGFTFFEANTGQGIADALIDLLIEGKPDADILAPASMPNELGVVPEDPVLAGPR